jgi:diacylglycerol kinase (ATP)
LSTLDKLEYEKYPPIATLPLGTGNDLSRTLEWGPGYTNEPLPKFIERVHQARVCKLDRWNVHCKPIPVDQLDPKDRIKTEKTLEKEEIQLEEQDFKMNNYFSIGGDAEIALDFHELREKKRGLFQNRLVNKGWYGAFSLKSILTVHGELRKCVEVELDGKPLVIPSSTRAIVILNLPSWASGADPWRVKASAKESSPHLKVHEPIKRKESPLLKMKASIRNLRKSDEGENQFEPQPQTLDDATFEVVGFNGAIHMGSTKARFSTGTHLGQGKHLKIRNTLPIPVQVDGEPWLLIPCETEVTHLNQANMLFNTHSNKRVKKFNSLTHEVSSEDLVLSPSVSPVSPLADEQQDDPPTFFQKEKKEIFIFETTEFKTPTD